MRSRNRQEAPRYTKEGSPKKKQKKRGFAAALFHIFLGTPHAALDTTFALSGAGAVGVYTYSEGQKAERVRNAIEASPEFQREIRRYMSENDREDSDEDKLGRSLASGEQRVMQRFGWLRYPGFETRIEHIRTNLFATEESRGVLSQTVTDELAYVAVGMAAQESEFNNAALSEAGARGIFQFMPQTEAEYENEGELDLTYLTDQVTAVEGYFRNAYMRIMDRSGDDLELIRSKYFTRDETGRELSEDESRRLFEATIIPLLLVNAFNAGPDRMAEVIEDMALGIHEFAEGEPEGYIGPYDVYVRMAQGARGDVAGYGRHSSEYPFRCFALAVLINERRNVQDS